MGLQRKFSIKKTKSSFVLYVPKKRAGTVGRIKQSGCATRRNVGLFEEFRIKTAANWFSPQECNKLIQNRKSNKDSFSQLFLCAGAFTGN